MSHNKGTWNRRAFIHSAAMTGALTMVPKSVLGSGLRPSASLSEQVSIDCLKADGPLPHIWEGCVGSDRAIVGLRQQWLSDLDRVKRDAGFRSVRFHGLFNDEMGVWPVGAKSPNFLYVDMVFDGLIQRGVKPFVELGFMPASLASGPQTAFFYRGNSTPPNDLSRWGELIHALANHCIERYGLQEVATWNFEVWNEPNLKYFWTGTQAQYFEIYRQAAMALKTANTGLRVGGPSTAQARWVGDLLAFCSSQEVPIDFVSTHIYPDDPQHFVFGEGTNYPYEEVIPRALMMVQDQIKSSKIPNLPLYITEWSSQNPALIAHTIKGTIGLADMMSYWTFDNVFEELGIPRQFMNSNFGLLGMSGVPRPSLHTFTLLHKLGDTRLRCNDATVLATRRHDGSIAVLAWNLIPQPPGRKHSSMGDPMLQTTNEDSDQGDTKQIVIRFDGERKRLKGHITRIDKSSGDFRRPYRDMGSPAYPTMQQIEQLKQQSELAKPEPVSLGPDRKVSLSIAPNGVVLLELT